MIKSENLKKLVALVVNNLPDSISERKKTLLTLLRILPGSFGGRVDIVKALEALRAHEVAQLKFRMQVDHDGHHNPGDHQ